MSDCTRKILRKRSWEVRSRPALIAAVQFFLHTLGPFRARALCCAPNPILLPLFSIPKEVYRNLTDLDVRQYLYQILLVLECAGEKRVVHLDLKPDNVLISPLEKRVTVIDWGRGRKVRHSTSALKYALPYVGAKMWAAPEVSLHEAEAAIGREADMWNAGEREDAMKHLD